MAGQFNDTDPDADKRKEDHISLAFRSRVESSRTDRRFYYEPALAGHPSDDSRLSFIFSGKKMNLPIWVSSMTGGTEKASVINKNLARACREFGMGMGLGSCRQLLTDDTYLEDFRVRHLIGEQPLYANLGIAQIIQLLDTGKTNLITELLKKLEADGLIVHINPLQEYLQPEGDRYFKSPVEVLKKLFNFVDPSAIIVKEVGQGMGKQSLSALLALPVAAVDFAAHGGTNFSLLELLRTPEGEDHPLLSLVKVGHTASEMVDMVNEIVIMNPDSVQCKQIIISGGVSDFLDGYYLINKIKLPAVYGQASGFLKHSMGAYEDLQKYVATQREGLLIAQNFLRIKL